MKGAKSCIVPLSARELRRRVRHCPKVSGGDADAAVLSLGLGHAKVRDGGGERVGDEDVFGLEVAVHDGRVVLGVQVVLRALV